MKMNGTSKANCSEIIPDYVFFTSTVWLFLSSIISIIGNAFVLLVLQKSHSLHSNVRLLLKNFTFASCLLSVSLLSKSVYHVYVWQYGFFPMTPAQCGFFELLWDLGSSTAAFSVVCIGIERMRSTVWKRTFADFDRPSAEAYCLLGACWANGILTPLLLILLSALAQPAQKRLCYCHVVFSTPPYFMYLLVPAYTALETMTLIFYMILYRHSKAEFTNFTINTTRHSLAQRYQMLNNINTIVLLMPTIIIHGACYVFVTAALTYLISMVGEEQNLDSKVINYVSLLTNMFSTEPVLQAVLLIVGNRSYRKIALGFFPKLRDRLNGNRIADVGGVPAVATLPFRNSDERKQAKSRRTYTIGGSNGGSRGIVEFRMGPEVNDDILKSIWNAKSF